MKNPLLATVFIFAFALLSSHAFAASGIVLTKSVQNGAPKVGDGAVILLDIQNPFKSDVTLRIADKNVFAGNGVDAQCLEYTIPAASTVRMSYDPITLFKGGKYSLGPARATYNNPDTGKEETVYSNSLDVSISGAGSSGASQQAITTIYRCDGQSMTYTSYTSSGQPAPSGPQPGEEGTSNNQASGGSQQALNPAEKVQNNQMPQDAGAIKQEIERQAQEKTAQQNAFADKLSQSREVSQLRDELSKKGYMQSGQSLSPKTNGTGTFEIDYKNQNGDAAKIEGRMENGTVSEAYMESREDTESIMQLLQNNSRYQKYSNELNSTGFSRLQPPEVRVYNSSYAEAKVPYLSESNISANISATIANMTVAKVELLREDRKAGWYFLVISALIAAAYFMYRRHVLRARPEIVPQIRFLEPKISYRKQAKSMLMRARELFLDGREKEAYGMVSEAVRFYFREKLSLKKEITPTELTFYMKSNKHKGHGTVQKCLNLCSLVEFAKYKPNREDFSNILGLAEKVVD